jgi:SAM-dependent methyltransferase
MIFNWDVVQYKEDGKVLLLYRHERIFIEGLVKPGMEIMDVGGWGHLTERIQQEGASCVVLDNFSPDQYFPDRVKQNPYLVGDIGHLDFGSHYLENRFDVICCFETLEHVGDISHQSTAMFHIARMLKTKGVFVGTVPIPGFCHYLGEPGVHFLNEEELRKLLQEAGFVDIFIEPTGSVTKDGPLSSLYFRGVKQ